MLAGEPLAERPDAAAFGGVMAGSKEMQPLFTGAVDGLLRNFTADKSVDAKSSGRIDKALAAAAAPRHPANQRRGVITAVQRLASKARRDLFRQRRTA
ncbi:hypothetical protein E05_08020 [Plautia stali symbiont]|nr:hypothetical protein E05_08020 [Plautia stali symbiont]